MKTRSLGSLYRRQRIAQGVSRLRSPVNGYWNAAMSERGPMQGMLLGKTYIVIDVLATDVEKCIREIARRHGKTVVDHPKRSAVARADAREATTRGRVGLKHDEGLPGSDGDLRRVEVLRDHVHGEAVT